MSCPCASTVLSHIRVLELTRVRSGQSCVPRTQSTPQQRLTPQQVLPSQLQQLLCQR
jgi:hypothetical protein